MTSGCRIIAIALVTFGVAGCKPSGGTAGPPKGGAPPPVSSDYDFDGFEERLARVAPVEAVTEHEHEPGLLDGPAVMRTLTMPAVAAMETLAEPAMGVFVFNCGQADSMLVVAPTGETLLVDLGESNSGTKENFLLVANRILEITGEPHLDYLVVSHFHGDHIGGANTGIDGLLRQTDPQFTIGTLIDVGEIGSEYMSPSRKTKDTYEEDASAWLALGFVSQRVHPEFGTQLIQLGDVEVDIVTFGGMTSAGEPGVFERVVDYDEDRYEQAPGSENDISIGLIVRYGDFELFTAGDLTGYDPDDAAWANWDHAPLFTPRSFGQSKSTYTNVETTLAETLLARGPGVADVEVYRANHHGSRYSTSPEFLEALSPEFVLYSCGGQYDHPEVRVLEAVNGIAEQYATTTIATKSAETFDEVGGMLVGEIEILVDRGGSYRINGEMNEALSDAEEAALVPAGAGG